MTATVVTSLHVRGVTPPAKGALPALMQNVPHLLIYFLFPLYRSLLLASGLLHVDRRPTLLLSLYKCVWNEMKKDQKIVSQYCRVLISRCISMCFPTAKICRWAFRGRERKRVRDSRVEGVAEKSTIIVSDTDELRSNGQKSYYFYHGVFFWRQRSFENPKDHINVYEMYLLT